MSELAAANEDRKAKRIFDNHPPPAVASRCAAHKGCTQAVSHALSRIYQRAKALDTDRLPIALMQWFDSRACPSCVMTATRPT